MSVLGNFKGIFGHIFSVFGRLMSNDGTVVTDEATGLQEALLDGIRNGVIGNNTARAAAQGAVKLERAGINFTKSQQSGLNHETRKPFTFGSEKDDDMEDSAGRIVNNEGEEINKEGSERDF